MKNKLIFILSALTGIALISCGAFVVMLQSVIQEYARMIDSERARTFRFERAYRDTVLNSNKIKPLHIYAKKLGTEDRTK